MRSPIDRVLRSVVTRTLHAVDPTQVLDTVDLDELLAMVDVNVLLDRVDVNRLLERVDVDRLVARIDLDALMAKVDLDVVVDRVDPDRLLARVDVRDLVARAGIEEVVARASAGVAHGALWAVRRRVRRIDEFWSRPRGRPVIAGPVSRLLAFLADWAVITKSFGLAISVASVLLSQFSGGVLSLQRTTSPWWLLGYLVWWWLFVWTSMALTGRTPGKALLGLTIRTADDGPVGTGRAAVRALAFLPASVLGLGLLPVLRRRRPLHDLAAGTVVGYARRE